MDENRVVIIGAGPAGLTAAYQLLKTTDIKPIIIEESAFIGGIARTVVYNNNRIDIGGHRFFTKNEQVKEIWETLMPSQGAPSMDDIKLRREFEWAPNGPDPEKEDIVFLKRNRVSRIFYLRKFFDYPISLKTETFMNMGFARTLKVGTGYLASVLHKRKEESLEDFYINRFGKPLYQMFFEDYTTKLWGVHPSKIAPDWGAQRVKGLSLLKMVLSFFTKPFVNSAEGETSLIEEFQYPKYGPGQFWETMADEITKLGGRIFFDTAVDKIVFTETGSVKLRGTMADGVVASYSGEALFSSMPIKNLVEAIGEAVPTEVSQIAAELPYRDFITVGLLLDKMLIKNETKMETLSDIVPDCWIYIQEPDVQLGRVQIFNNWSPYMVDKPEDTVWIGLEYFCTEGDEKWNLSEDEFIEFAKDELEKIGMINKEDVLDATCIKVKKAYPAYFGSYSKFDTVKDYLNSIDKLYCIGRNGQHRYNNMDHSMLTAIEAVNCYVNDTRAKASIWKVNTESEYHEGKKEVVGKDKEQTTTQNPELKTE